MNIGSVLSNDAYPVASRVPHRVLPQLGSGTGLGGLALAALGEKLSVTLSDRNMESVDLCSHNLAQNLPSHASLSKVTTQNLAWSMSSPASKYDAAFACDVVYDLSILPPLMATASLSLKPGKTFVLSHVPRANVDETRAVGKEEEIVSKIKEEGERWGLDLSGEWRSCEDDSEGSILLFLKNNCDI